MMEREERLQKKKRSEAPSRTQQVTAAAARRPRAEGTLWQRVRRYFHEVRVELKKVSWPTRDQMKNFTTVTVITSIALTLLVFGLDFGLKELVLLALGGINNG